MKNYQFSIEIKSIGLGCVKAESLEEAKEKIKNKDWDDIYETVGAEYGDLIEIE
jgi:hypothetical protein